MFKCACMIGCYIVNSNSRSQCVDASTAGRHGTTHRAVWIRYAYVYYMYVIYMCMLIHICQCIISYKIYPNYFIPILLLIAIFTPAVSTPLYNMLSPHTSSPCSTTAADKYSADVRKIKGHRPGTKNWTNRIKDIYNDIINKLTSTKKDNKIV